MLRSKLRRGERCPIHGLYYGCCGREPRKEGVRKSPKVTGNQVLRIADEHHPNGYRELRGPEALRRLKEQKIREQSGICRLCETPFRDYREVELDHLEPRGLGGSRRNDHGKTPKRSVV